MRRDWDARARKDAKEYISSPDVATGVRFAFSGLDDTRTILEDVHSFLAQDSKVLEIGCGIGRLLRFFALLFDEVHGIDVSPEMIAQSKEYLAQFPNVTTCCGDGSSLSPFENQTFDFVFSYVVFPHIPDKDIIRQYIHETKRVLKPGGLFKFLVKYKDWEGAGESPDTWNGVNVSVEDIESWRDETGFELVNTYGLDDHLGWAVFRAPA
jgi:SAM-dependent methyltransferase